MKNEMVVKSNNLIEGFIEMTRQEYLIVLYLISKIKKEDNNFMVQKVKVSDFSEMLGISSEHVYSQMANFEDSLIGRFIKIKYENGDRLKVPWFGYLKYYAGKGILEACFNSELKDSLLNLNTKFTKYYLKNVKKLDSQYSIRLYELLKQYEKIGFRIIEIEKLKLILGIGINQYRNYNDFKRRVLKKPIEKINANEETDIKVMFEEIKIGRKFDKIKFYIQKKETEKNLKSTQTVKNTKSNTEHQDLISKFKEKTGAELHIKRLEELIQKKGIDTVTKYINNFHKLQTAGINNIASFFYKAVLDEYPLDKKASSPNINIPQHNNFEQRRYDVDFLRSLYEDV